MCYGLRDRRVSEDLFECAEVVRAGESDESDGADGVGEVWAEVDGAVVVMA